MSPVPAAHDARPTRPRTRARARARAPWAHVIAAAAAATLLGACSAGPIDVAGRSNGSLLMGMVAHWTLDDATGSTMALDSSGNAHHGAVTGGTWIPGHFGGALHFESGDEISVPTFPNATSGWSVALWVRPPAQDLGTDYVTLISTEIPLTGTTAGGGWQMNLMQNLSAGATGSYYQFGYWLGPLAGDYDAADCACVDTQQWTHIAGVVDSVAGTARLYKNGVFETAGQYLAGSAQNKPIRPGSETLYMGRWSRNGRLLIGDLDDVVVYDRPLTPSEVAALFLAAAPDQP